MPPVSRWPSQIDAAPGELVLVEGSSFPLFAHLWDAKSYWTVRDAATGLLASGEITPREALAVTRPSLWAGHETRRGGGLAPADFAKRD